MRVKQCGVRRHQVYSEPQTGQDWLTVQVETIYTLTI